MGKRFDGSAIGSDIPRSLKQYIVRTFSRILVSVIRLNHPGFISTEIVQAIQPVEKIKTTYGTMLCRCNHGRLLWRARTFHTEEPQTVSWLDTLKQGDVLWDIGANVGLYSIYAARFRGCKVIAIEPESQNYAILVENIALNHVGDRVFPACMAIADHFGIGHLYVRYITKGGAYNMFRSTNHSNHEGSLPVQDDKKAIPGEDEINSVEQLIFGVSLDELVLKYGFAPPTHLKIDVDGLEPEIINGASKLLELDSLRSILIEINRKSERDMLIPEILTRYGFQAISERSNWLSRADRTKEHEVPTTNMIFSRV